MYLGMRQAELSARYVKGPSGLVALDGASHRLHEERPDDVAEVIAARVAAPGS